MIRSRVSLKELTKKQAPQISIDGLLLDNQLPDRRRDFTYADYREFKKDSTVALIREVAPGPILAANWTIESEKGVAQSWIKRIEEDFLKIRTEFLTQAVRGLNDYGWMPFEKVWEKDSSGYLRLKKLKALLHEFTWILVDENGSFRGFRQDDFNKTTIPVEKCLLLSQDVEGTNWYGEGKLEIVGRVTQNWDRCNDGADRYDSKVAGSHWVVYYPIGHTIVNDVDTDNYEVAGNILNALESSGKMRIPSSLQSEIESLNMKGESAWRIELLSDSDARQYSFVARLEYLDKLKCRGYGFPEDVILKTKYSPKTEQGVHANIIATAQDVQHRYIVEMLNKHIIDQLLRYNHGKKAEGKIWIENAPITNMSLTFLQDVYKMLLNNQSFVVSEAEHVDMPELRAKIAIPNDGENPDLSQFGKQDLNQTAKAVEDATQDGSFKAEGVQN